MSPARAIALRKNIRALNLGWYEHVAMEAVYRRAGLNEQAVAEAGQAQKSSQALLRFWQIREVVGRFGLILLAALGGFGLWRLSRFGLSSKVLPGVGQVGLTHAQSNGLLVVFGAYIVSLAALQIGVVRFLPSMGDLTERTGIAGALLSMGLMAVWFAVPCVLLMVVARRTGLSASQLGFRSSSLPIDIAWGVAGYAIALPVIWGAGWLSEVIFHRPESVLPPILTSFAGANEPLVQALILMQAAAIAPLMEEVLFRGVLFQAAAAKIGMLRGLILTTTTFAFVHPQIPSAFLGLLALGLVFNLLFIFRRSLASSITAHALNNGVIFLSLSLLLAT